MQGRSEDHCLLCRFMLQCAAWTPTPPMTTNVSLNVLTMQLIWCQANASRIRTAVQKGSSAVASTACRLRSPHHPALWYAHNSHASITPLHPFLNPCPVRWPLHPACACQVIRHNSISSRWLRWLLQLVLECVRFCFSSFFLASCMPSCSQSCKCSACLCTCHSSAVSEAYHYFEARKYCITSSDLHRSYLLALGIPKVLSTTAWMTCAQVAGGCCQ
jgi:hypothetical protein